MSTSQPSRWPEPLQRPDPARVQALLFAYWEELRRLARLLPAHEHLLAAQCTASLRRFVAEMMLALNGIAWPSSDLHLNLYLSARQRAALERTLIAPAASGESWIGQAVALTVIYRWYAPQLAAAFGLEQPAGLEAEVWAELRAAVYGWPAEVSTG